MILAQMKDKCPFESIWEQEKVLCQNWQDTMSNAKWCKMLNMRVDMANMVGMTQQHGALLEHVTQEVHNKSFENHTKDQKTDVRADTEERCPVFAMPKTGGKQHAKQKTDL